MKTRVVKAIFVETGTYNDLTTRPFKTNVDVSTLRAMQEATNMGTSITAASIAPIAGNILRPSAISQGVADISNGWDTPRFRFMLEVEILTNSNFATERQVITGYTDHVGALERNGQMVVNPQMRMFFNNSVKLRAINELTPWGVPSVRQTVVNASQLLSGVYQPSFNGGRVTQSMRPEDLFATSSLGVLADEDVIDTRVTFGGGHIKKSNRKNSSAPEYLARVMEAHKSAVNHGDSEFTDYTRMMDQARSFAQDELVSDDVYLYNLMNRTSLGHEASVTYGELCTIDEQLDSIAFFSLRSPTEVVHTRGSTEHWQGSTVETMSAIMLVHSVPSIMMDLMLTGVSFMATNRTLDGSYDVRLAGSKSFATMDMSEQLVAFRQRLIVEVLRNLTNNNRMEFDIKLQVDLLGETFVSISINGGPHVDYTMPSFCDALVAPVITDDRNDLTYMANDMNSLSDNLSVSSEAPLNHVTL